MEKIQINKIRDEKGNVTTDTLDIHRIIKIYHKQLYANKLEDLKEVGRFLDTYNLLKLNLEQINSLKIESLNKFFPTKKSSGPDGFITEFY